MFDWVDDKLILAGDLLINELIYVITYLFNPISVSSWVEDTGDFCKYAANLSI